MASLNRPAVPFECIHTVPWQKGKDTDLSRDVICCLINFRFEENVLRAARVDWPVKYRDDKIFIYQDLSAITLQIPRTLRPMFHALWERNKPYPWRFSWLPKQAPQYHEDLPTFCKWLGLPLIDLKGWLCFLPPQATCQLLPKKIHPLLCIGIVNLMWVLATSGPTTVDIWRVWCLIVSHSPICRCVNYQASGCAHANTRLLVVIVEANQQVHNQ